jgi:hypothetical protein
LKSLIVFLARALDRSPFAAVSTFHRARTASEYARRTRSDSYRAS